MPLGSVKSRKNQKKERLQTASRGRARAPHERAREPQEREGDLKRKPHLNGRVEDSMDEASVFLELVGLLTMTPSPLDTLSDVSAWTRNRALVFMLLRLLTNRLSSRMESREEARHCSDGSSCSINNTRLDNKKRKMKRDQGQAGQPQLISRNVKRDQEINSSRDQDKDRV